MTAALDFFGRRRGLLPRCFGVRPGSSQPHARRRVGYAAVLDAPALVCWSGGHRGSSTFALRPGAPGPNWLVSASYKPAACAAWRFATSG